MSKPGPPTWGQQEGPPTWGPDEDESPWHIPEAPKRQRSPLPFVLGGLLVVVIVAGTVVGVLLATSRGGSNKTATVSGGNTTTTALPRTAILFGTLNLHDPETAAASCQGQGGYSDIRSGLQAEMLDSHGDILATGVLVGGARSPSSPTTCTYSFVIPNVPTSSTFYQLELGGTTRRGRLTYTRSELEARHWNIDIELGQSSRSTTTTPYGSPAAAR